jgi:UDP-N-acetylglucosamine 2-epimerase (non-hydrolysing)
MARPRIACVVGTRPDAIKTMPVILALDRMGGEVECLVLSTGQHREMLQQVFETFGRRPDHDLDLMKQGQSLAGLTSRALDGIDQALERFQPDMVMAQGDTTTTFVASLASFYRGIKFGHIEAGLRTSDLRQPFPEEFNRRAAAIVADHHYAPTQEAADNLLREGHASSRIFVTGNTGIDAVQMVAERLPQTWLPEFKGRVILMTTHRRENWGDSQRAISRAALALVDQFPDTRLVVPMHKNPLVRDVLQEELGGHDRIDLIEPPEYESFVKLMQRAHLILTDSGGVQEEAPTFGVPVLVLRDTTERPEGVRAGCALLVGADEEKIKREGSRLLTDEEAYRSMAKSASPYGDGQAAARIVSLALKLLKGE